MEKYYDSVSHKTDEELLEDASSKLKSISLESLVESS